MFSITINFNEIIVIILGDYIYIKLQFFHHKSVSECRVHARNFNTPFLDFTLCVDTLIVDGSIVRSIFDYDNAKRPDVYPRASTKMYFHWNIVYLRFYVLKIVYFRLQSKIERFWKYNFFVFDKKLDILAYFLEFHYPK